MASKYGPELRNTAVALLIAAPTYPDWFPLAIKVVLLIIAISLAFWTWAPHQIGKVRMTFGLALAATGGLVLVIGLFLHFMAPAFLMGPSDGGGRPMAAYDPTDKGASGSHNVTTGPVTGQVAGTINNYNAPPHPPVQVDQDAIQQGGITVARVYGGRRSPTDATKFQFVEINHAQQFNVNAPFTYQGVTLQIVSVDTMIGMDASRPQEGKILKTVTARVL